MVAYSDLRDNKLSEDKVDAIMFHRFPRLAPPTDGTSTSGLDAALLFVIRVLAAIPDVWRSHVAQAADTDEMREIRGNIEMWDVANPLIRFLWCSTGAPESESSRLWEDVRRMAPTPSFAAIVNNFRMEKTFWSREPLLLVTGYTFKSDGGVLAHVRNRAADVSMFVWTGRDADGRPQTLADAIHSQLASSDEAATVFGSWDGPSNCFRVLYTPDQDDQASYSFRNLQTVVVNPFESFTDEMRQLAAAQGLTCDDFTRQYHLAVAVRQRATARDEDHARVCLINGMHSRGTQSSMPSSSDDWQLGDPGHSYALFYVRTNTRTLSSAGTPKVVPALDPSLADRQVELDGLL